MLLLVQPQFALQFVRLALGVNTALRLPAADRFEVAAATTANQDHSPALSLVHGSCEELSFLSKGVVLSGSSHLYSAADGWQALRIRPSTASERVWRILLEKCWKLRLEGMECALSREAT